MRGVQGCLNTTDSSPSATAQRPSYIEAQLCHWRCMKVWPNSQEHKAWRVCNGINVEGLDFLPGPELLVRHKAWCTPHVLLPGRIYQNDVKSAWGCKRSRATQHRLRMPVCERELLTKCTQVQVMEESCAGGVLQPVFHTAQRHLGARSNVHAL